MAKGGDHRFFSFFFFFKECSSLRLMTYHMRPSAKRAEDAGTGAADFFASITNGSAVSACLDTFGSANGVDFFF